MGRRSTLERVEFLDPVVNGKLLRDHLQIDDMDAGCTGLRSGWPLGEGLAWLDQLAHPSWGGLATGRVAILVCQVCADVDCGVLSVSIERSGGVVRWSRFGWEWPDGGRKGAPIGRSPPIDSRQVVGSVGLAHFPIFERVPIGIARPPVRLVQGSPVAPVRRWSHR